MGAPAFKTIAQLSRVAMIELHELAALEATKPAAGAWTVGERVWVKRFGRGIAPGLVRFSSPASLVCVILGPGPGGVAHYSAGNGCTIEARYTQSPNEWRLVRALERSLAATKRGPPGIPSGEPAPKR